MAELVNKTYSEALFDVALEQDTLKDIQKEFAFLISVFEENPQYFELIKSPKVSMAEKKAIVCDAFQKDFSESFMNFLKIVIDKQREGELFGIKKAYDERINNHFNIIESVVESVIPLTDDQLTLLSERLCKISGKKVILRNSVNKDLIGGIVVTLGDRVIDGSIRYKLDTMLEGLTQIII